MFFELLSHKYGTEAIKGWEVGVWTALKATASACQISLQWDGSSHSFFSCKFYEITLTVSKPCCPETSSLVLLPLPCSSRRHLQRASCWAKLLLGQFWEISAAVCPQRSNIADEQHRAPCAITPGSPRSFLVLSILKWASSYWNKLMIFKNYCNNPGRNHRLQTWNPDCFQLNTNNRSILRQLAFVKPLSQFTFATVFFREPLRLHV